MTLKNHPDKAGGSESKMIAINEAYEVLSTPGEFPCFTSLSRFSNLTSDFDISTRTKTKIR